MWISFPNEFDRFLSGYRRLAEDDLWSRGNSSNGDEKMNAEAYSEWARNRVDIVFDLFSGTGSATSYYRKDPRYKVLSVDNATMNENHVMGSDHHYEMDIFDFYKSCRAGEIHKRLDQCYGKDGWQVVFIWASPDCKRFSMAGGSAMGDHWLHGHPISPECFTALRNVSSVIKIVELFDPPYWVIENPVGMLRTVPMMGLLHRRTVTYCQYEDPHKRMKPTDLFGILPPTFKALSCQHGDKCHVPAPRGSKNGTQGLSYEEKIKIPEKLQSSIKFSCEDLDWYRLRWSSLSDFDSESLQGGGKHD